MNFEKIDSAKYRGDKVMDSHLYEERNRYEGPRNLLHLTVTFDKMIIGD